MRNLKLLSGVLLLLVGLWFSACSKKGEKPAAPTIEVIHIGTHDLQSEGLFYLGEDAHFEVNINAPARVEKIDLEINQVSGYATFRLTKTYQGEYVGKKQILSFQDYPQIPLGEAIGTYNFRLSVTDQQGQVGSINKEITVDMREGGPIEHEH